MEHAALASYCAACCGYIRFWNGGGIGGRAAAHKQKKHLRAAWHWLVTFFACAATRLRR